MESTKIQEFDLDPNCGFAKEETAQAILEAVGNGMVKKVQRGIITISTSSTTGTATISAVDTSKAVVLWGGKMTTTGSVNYANAGEVNLVLTNSTRVTASVGIAIGEWKIPYQVIEYY